MKNQVKRNESPERQQKAPYERPELKKVGGLRDVTAAGTEDT